MALIRQQRGMGAILVAARQQREDAQRAWCRVGKYQRVWRVTGAAARMRDGTNTCMLRRLLCRGHSNSGWERSDWQSSACAPSAWAAKKRASTASLWCPWTALEGNSPACDDVAVWAKMQITQL